MKISLSLRRITYILLILLGIVSLSACDRNKTSTTVVIDNPTDNTMQISIDGTSHNISPFQFLEIELAFGEHEMNFLDGDFHPDIDSESVHFYLIPTKKKKLLLNPSGETYVLTEQYYSNNLKEIEVKHNVIINGYEYYDDALIYNNFYINADYDYGIDKKLPDEVYLFANQDKAILKKIFRLDDYRKYYLTEWADVIKKSEEKETAPQIKNFAPFVVSHKLSYDLSHFENRKELHQLLQKYVQLQGQFPANLSNLDSFNELKQEIESLLITIKNHEDYNDSLDKSSLENISIFTFISDDIKQSSVLEDELIFFEPRPIVTN
ncbi:hypothetical protein [Thorsellia anophelis]|uniref:Uncharacterized protein n=1 Tax=Thorsellia anophelis DSM 18579 TaxID=1123402 RepID=A0A1I0BJG7_9GAMM|nr:hypothetical protein [Thorsellia anophelis]SET06781.1 hypothetical protein SAMN02583745_01273 [Thorsellia anophelis DSM 18579]